MLGYESRKMDATRRPRRKSPKIRERLGGKQWDEGISKKPPRMWRRKYERLRRQAEEADQKGSRLSGHSDAGLAPQ